MKNLKALGVLILAMAMGLGAAVYAAAWVARQGQAQVSRVVVAAADIEMGRKLAPHMLSTVDWPTGALPADVFGELKDLQDRVLKVGVLKGEALVARKLTPVGSPGGLSSVISEGKRAMTVRVNDVVGVAGFALPGTYVDVMVNTQREASARHEGGQISKTVLEQVLVLAVAQESSRDETQPKVVSAVTLELWPQDAEKLDLARSVGSLSLVLRNQVDRQSVRTVGTTKQQLLGAEAAVEPPRAQGKVRPAATPVPPPSPALAARVLTDSPTPVAGPCVEVIQHGARVTHCF